MSQPQFQTPVTELFGIRHPILAGGLMWLSDANYVAAVVNAGCMGFITAKTFPDPDAFRDELQKARTLTGGKAFGVNIYLSVHRDDTALVSGHIDILLEEGVRFVETSGLPPADILGRLKDGGCTVIHKVAAVRHALSAAKLPVDAITVVGAECGGHPGLHMVGSIVQALRAAQVIDKPLAVGGGFGHGAQLVAALAMGAGAILVGTRFLVAEEIWAHGDYKERLIEAGETDTRVIMARLRNTYRVLDNEAARAVEALELQGKRDFEDYRALVGGGAQKTAYDTGDWNQGVLSMGQSAVFADQVMPVAAIVDQIMDEAGAALARLDSVRQAQA